MDREMEVTGWTKQWLTRDLPFLHYETISVSYVLTLAMLAIGTKSLYNTFKTRRALDQNPSDHAAILAKSDKRLHKSMNKQRALSYLLFAHSMTLWFADAAIGMSYIYADVSENPSEYSPSTWVNLIIYCTGLFVMFTAITIIFPLFQVGGAALLIRFLHPKPDQPTLGNLLPQMEILSTQLSYLWLYIGFACVSWWPVLDDSLLRVVILEAAFGSGMAWLYTSRVLANVSDELLETPMTIKEYAERYIMQGFGFEKTKQDALPQYEAVAQYGSPTDEKTVF